MSASEGRITQQIGAKCTDSAPGKYYFFNLDTSESTAAQIVVERAGANDQIFGISYEDTAAANRNIGLNISGICFLVVDGNAGAIAVGSYLKSDASGQGVATTTDTEEVGAVALEASTTAGEVILVEIRKFTYAG